MAIQGGSPQDEGRTKGGTGMVVMRRSVHRLVKSVSMVLLILGLGGLPSMGAQREIEIPEGCELCRALGEAYISGEVLAEEWRLPEAYDLRAVLEFLDRQVDLATRAAAVVATATVLLPAEEDVRTSVSQVRSLLDSYGSDNAPRRADQAFFLLGATWIGYSYVSAEIPLGRDGDYIEAHSNVREYIQLAWNALDTCVDALDASDLEEAIGQMRVVYASLVAARGFPKIAGLVPGTIAMKEMVLSHTETVRFGESIQVAIDRVHEGGTILIEPGVYRESLTITKSLNLVGGGLGAGVSLESPTVALAADGLGSIVAVAGEAERSPLHVALREVSVRGGEIGVRVEHANVELFGVEVTGSDQGVVVGGGGRLAAADLTIQDCGEALTAGLDADCSVTESRIGWSRSPYGAIVLQGHARLGLFDCEVSDNVGAGLLARDPDVELQIENCEFLRNGTAGVMLTAFMMKDRAFIESFGHLVTGRGNRIPGPNEPEGNGEMGIFPASFGYLTEP